MSKLFIEQEYLKILISVFDKCCPKATIWAYGSRLNGNAHEGSDLDLVVKDFGDKKCNLSEFREILSQSNIPFLIDILEFNSLPEAFQIEILKDYKVIYTAENQK